MSETDKERAKAFKKAFGVKASTTDWKGVMAGLDKNLPELKKWVDVLGSIPTLQAEQARAQAELDQFNRQAAAARKLFETDKKKGGELVRDAILPRLLASIDANRKIAKNAKISHPVNGKAVDVFWTDIPGYETLDPASRTAGIAAVAEKTAKGLKLYDTIASRVPLAEPLPPATPEDVTNLMWGLKSKAQEKGGAYTKGAMTVPNGAALRDYLDSCGEVYPRSSSHHLEQQGKGKKGTAASLSSQGQSARGMDFYKAKGAPRFDPANTQGLLPVGMNTLLYQKVTPVGGGDFLYMKMETEGAFGSGGANAKRDSTAPKGRAKRDGDTMNTIKHGLNLAKGLLGHKDKDKDLVATREQTREEIVTVCEKIVKTVQNKQAKKVLAASYGTELRKVPIFSRAAPRMNSFLLALDKAGKDGLLGDEVDDLVAELVSLIGDLYPDEDEDSRRRRTGDEVLLTEGDLA